MKYILSIFFSVFAGLAVAQSYPEPSDLSVNDFAGIIGEQAEQRLAERLDALREETDVELVVVTLSRQDMFAPDISLKKFGRGIFDEWGIGDKTRDDGILVLVLRGDQALRITLGQAYGNTAETAADAAVERSFLPEFREGRYEEGIETGVADLIANVVRPSVEARGEDGGESVAEAQAASGESTTASEEASTAADSAATGEGAPEGEGGGLSILLWIGGGIAALIAFFTIKGKTRKCPQCGARGSLGTQRTTVVEATETSAGKGERITTCEKCDYRDTETYEIAKLEKPEPEPEPEKFSGGEAGKKGSTGKW